MRVIITGASGLIGRKVAKRFMEDGVEVIAICRNPNRMRELINDSRIFCQAWPGPGDDLWDYWFSEPCVLLNLAGENIASGYWTNARKEKILESRLQTTDHLVNAMRQAKSKPLLFASASAAGFYGNRKGERMTELSRPGSGFLASVVKAWERSAQIAEAYGVRTVLLRTGVVLSAEGGALPKMAAPVKLFAGAWPGNGKQHISWIHIDDWVNALMFIIKHAKISGAVNVTAPESVPVKQLLKATAKALKRPVWGGIPTFLLKAIMGEMADETLLVDQNVNPAKLLSAGFIFKYPLMKDAVNQIYSRSTS